MPRCASSAPACGELEAEIAGLVTGAELERFEEARKHYGEAGLPPPLAARIASLEALNAALDIVEIAASASRERRRDRARVFRSRHAHRL